LPEGNAGVGFSAGGVSAVGFIVKIAAIHHNVDPSVALCRSQRARSSLLSPIALRSHSG
jgi:hypothetical protein